MRHLWRAGVGLAGVPGLDFLLSHGAGVVLRPALGDKLTAEGNPAARDLMRHALADVAGNSNRARAWSKFARRWPSQPPLAMLDEYAGVTMPVLLLWSPLDQSAPLAWAREALDLLPEAHLRELPGTGFLVAYDDPVGLARELISFCG
jgi:pimeloyl-ACP methyl ester carboxylesterase